MGGRITINAKNIVGNSSGETRYDAETITNIAGTRFIQNAKEGIINDVNEPRKPIKTESTQIKEIELLTTLNEGSANDGTGGMQKGMVFGKAYEVRVKSYTNGEPKDKSKIKWIVKYHSLSKNKWIEIHPKNTGENYHMGADVKEMCGRYIYVGAYIEDIETKVEMKIWKHNRFRYFDRQIVEKEIEERTYGKKPWKIDQSGTSLCGMACIFYLFAKEQPENYKKFAKELFRTGEASFNKYTVKPSNEVLNKKPYIQGFPVSNRKYMPLIDYITMAGTRNTDNPSYKGGDEEFEAINWTPLLTTLSEDLLGYKDVSSSGAYNPIANIAYSSDLIEIKIDDINKQIRDGYRMILMIDSDLIDDVWDIDSFDLHWIVLESEIKEVKMLNEKGKTVVMLDFRLYSWGTNPNNNDFIILNKKTKKPEENFEYRYLKRPITKTHFMNNYNGYIKIK